MGPARASATMWSAASPDGAVRGSRLALPPLTFRSTSSVPRPDLPPHRRRCLQLAVAGRHRPLLQFFERSFQRCNRGGEAIAVGRFVAYYRVSTDRQGRSGLGLEAQREAVQRYLDGGSWTLADAVTAGESGRGDRP